MGGNESSQAETLMNTLISKMESMDTDITLLKAENTRLRRLLSNPDAMMKQMGLIPISTPFSEDVLPDGFRPSGEDAVLKGFDSLPQDTVGFHNTSWDEIHAMANSAKEAGHVDEPFKVITGRDNE